MTKSMTSGNPAKLILFFSLPLIVGNIFQQFYSMADTVIVGRTLGVNALAAVGCTGSITFFVFGFVGGFTTGLSIITSQYFGAENMIGVKRSFAASIILSGIVTVVLTLFSVVFAKAMLQMLKTPKEILDEALSYLIIIFWGTGASVMFNLASNMMRALGDSKHPLYFLILACGVNIVLDYVFICYFHMGVAGAGIATVIAQLLSGICCFWYIGKKIPQLRIGKEDMIMAKSELRRHFTIAMPMAFQMSIIAIGALILQFALNGLGAVAVAAYTAAQRIESIATMPMNSFGMTMSTYAAQNYGAGKIQRIKSGVFQCILISVSFSILMSLVNIIAGSGLVSVFVSAKEVEVLELAKTYLVITSICYWILSLLFVYRFTLQGLGRGLIPTIAGIAEMVMRAFAAMALVGPFGFAGAAVANPLAWLGACIPLAVAYYWIINMMSKKFLHKNKKKEQIAQNVEQFE